MNTQHYVMAKAIGAALVGVIIWTLARGWTGDVVAAALMGLSIVTLFRFVPPRPKSTTRRDATIFTLTPMTAATMVWLIDRI